MKKNQNSSELEFSEMLKSPCKVFHGTSYAFDCTRMEDRGKGFWFTRNKIDAENYAQHGAERTQGTPRTFDAWVRLEKVLNLGNLYDRATDEVLMDLAHDAHLFQPDDETVVQKVDVGIVDNNESCRARHHE